jgi:hypothetical protein
VRCGVGAGRCLRLSGSIRRVGSGRFGESVGAVATSGLAAGAAAKMVGLGEDQEWTIVVEIFRAECRRGRGGILDARARLGRLGGGRHDFIVAEVGVVCEGQLQFVVELEARCGPCRIGK